jgi:hypothetical protein
MMLKATAAGINGARFAAYEQAAAKKPLKRSYSRAGGCTSVDRPLGRR